jgi:hypothetical protein
MSVDTLENTKAFRLAKLAKGVPDPMEEVNELHAVADSKFEKVGTYAPAPESNNIHDYMATLGEHAAAWGPEERKFIDRRKLYGPALAETVRQDFEIMEAESERPRYSLKPGELREVVKTDQSGRPVIEFYSDEATGVKPWLDMFKPQVVKYVSGGSAGISQDPSSTYSFDKASIVPEYVELQRRAAYQDSAEYKVTEAYRAAGKEVPPEVLANLRCK